MLYKRGGNIAASHLKKCYCLPRYSNFLYPVGTYTLYLCKV
jgi:hypothetical protein